MTIELDTIGSGFSLDKINANFQLIEDALNNNVLKRVIDLGEDNTMHTHLDMNLFKIVNDGNDIANRLPGVDPTDRAALQAALDALSAIGE